MFLLTDKSTNTTISKVFLFGLAQNAAKIFGLFKNN